MIKEAKLIQIGNSQGIRLPKTMISKYKLEGVCVLEEIEGGILIHAPDQGKLSWEDTYKEISGNYCGMSTHNDNTWNMA